MEEYLKARHKTLNKELTEATRDKMKATTLGQSRLAAIKVIELNARLTEINKAQKQLRNEATN